MPAIDPDNLQKAMDGAGVTASQLAADTGKSLTYICDIIKGRRGLKRSPKLRREIAESLNVPTHWIERQGSEVA